MRRWRRLTATRGRSAVFFGSLGGYVVVALLLPQPFLLGVPTGSYVVLGVLVVWVVALALIEARWKREDAWHRR